MSNDNEGSLLLLNQSGNVVDAALHEKRLLGLRIGRLCLLCLSCGLQTLFLLLLGLRAVFVENLEQLSRCSAQNIITTTTFAER